MLFAFEDVFSRDVDFKSVDNTSNSFYISGNPATLQYRNNIEMFWASLNYLDRNYKRTYDASVSQDVLASFYTLRKIDEKSFFAAGISYDDLRLKDMYGSREKDFYDDYFSNVDSSAGKTSYFGPQLNILYNVELAPDLFLGIHGNYGVERGLKDTFPQTITIMRNSSYKIGLDYRKESYGIGIFGRYYDNQTYYESVKRYLEVEPKTFMGYHVFYNENSSATSKKKRIRNGIELGTHFRIGKAENTVFNFAASYLYRSSTSEMYTSYSKPRGYWQREGIQIKSDVSLYSVENFSFRLYGEYLNFNDWGKSLISNTLILENMESYSTLGTLVSYQPSQVKKAWVGAEVGSAEYDYVEYLYPFEDKRSGLEWNVFTGAEYMFTSKLKAGLNLNYEKIVPQFYWDTDYFQNIGIGIILEHLFNFGYIGTKFEYLKQNPSNDMGLNRNYQFTLTYRRK